MELPIFVYDVLPSKKREKFINKRNVGLIKEFFREREKLQIAREDDLAHLKQLRKNRSINTVIYRRLKQVMILTYEEKRIDLIESIIKKSVRIGNSVTSYHNQPSEDN